MADPAAYGIGLEIALCLAGVVLLVIGLRQRWAAAEPGPAGRIVPWPGLPSELILYLMLPLAGAIALEFLGAALLRRTKLGPNEIAVWATLAFESGLLLGIGAFHLFPSSMRTKPHPLAGDPASPTAPPGAPAAGPIRSGAITFLVAMPLVFAAIFLWHGLLSCFGFEARDQDVVTLFQDLKTPAMKALFVFPAVILAPCAEELIFRAGIFRFLRTRISRVWAIAISALLFGGMHLLSAPLEGLASLLPLVVLGAVFALAYERTGRIGTTIVAHALFNLHTLIMLLLGVSS